jgi:hypothetical protein
MIRLAEEASRHGSDMGSLSTDTVKFSFSSFPIFEGKAGSLKLNLMGIGACEPTSASRIQRSSESFTMDCERSKTNGTLFGIDDWLNYLRDQAATYLKFVEQADDPLVKTGLLALALVCDEIVDNIEDHLTGRDGHAPRGPPSRLS